MPGTRNGQRKPLPKPPAQRSRESEARRGDKGWRRIPGGMISPEAVGALTKLKSRGLSAAAAIGEALIAAAALLRWPDEDE